MVSDLIRILEIQETEKKIETLKFQYSELVFDRKKVEKQKKKTFLSIQHKNEEI